MGPIDVQILEGPRLRAGRFSVAAEVIEGPDGLAPAELVLPGGGRVHIETEPVVIGRMPECSVVLSDPNVSRRHAEVRPGQRGVRGERPRLDQRHEAERGARSGSSYLATGDNITVGSTTLVFEML